MVTDLERNVNTCDQDQMPWVSNCGYDAVGAILKELYPSIKPRGTDWAKAGEVVAFNQTEFVPEADAADTYFDQEGYAYVPNSCKEEGTRCGVHLSLHGCGMGKWLIQKSWVENAGYLEWASTNDMIVLFPQNVNS